MKRWIRWPGVVAFFGLLAFLITFFLLWIDGIIERMIEKTGTTIVGAKVELDRADLSFFPLGLTLSRLQVTHPKKPMFNAFEASRIAFSIDGVELVRRKTIVEEMTIDSLQFNTPRKASGAITRRPKMIPDAAKKLVPKGLELPSLEFPDPREILKKETLHSLALIESLRADLRGQKEKWRQRLDELPNKDKLEEYRERIQKLRSAGKEGIGSILGSATDLIAIEKEIRQEVERLTTARMALKENLTDYEQRLKEAARAPLEDIRRLRDKYSLSAQGLSNLSRMLFGELFGQWMENFLYWYAKLTPFVARALEQKDDVSVIKPIRGRGVDVRFREQNPLPDFLIRKALVSVRIPAGALSGELHNITPDQDVIRVPLTFTFSGKELKNLRSVRLQGEFNRTDSSNPRDRATLEIRGYRIQDLMLSKSEFLPITLKRGLVELQAKAIRSGEAVDTQISADLKSVEFLSAKQETAKPLVAALASALTEVKNFSLQADVSGTLKDYRVRLTSDLDRILKQAITNQVQKQAARFEAELNSAISKKADPELADLKSGVSGLEGILDELAARLKLGDTLLKEAIGSPKEGLKLPF